MATAAEGLEADPQPHDGEDISDIWRGSRRERTRPVYWEWKCDVVGEDEYIPPTLSVRDGRWQFYMNADRSDQQLYDVVGDPSELINRADGNPEIVEALAAKLAAFKETLPDHDPMYDEPEGGTRL